MPTETAHVQLQLNEMPRQAGNWIGEDNGLDTEVFKAIGAKDAINRTYRDQRGNTISLHSAVFLEYAGRDYRIRRKSVIPLLVFTLLNPGISI